MTIKLIGLCLIFVIVGRVGLCLVFVKLVDWFFECYGRLRVKVWDFKIIE